MKEEEQQSRFGPGLRAQPVSSRSLQQRWRGRALAVAAGCIPVADSCAFVMNFVMFLGLSEAPAAGVGGARDSPWGRGSLPLPSPSSTSDAWCWAEPGNCWGFIGSSFPVTQLWSESGGSFWCGGIPGHRKGLRLKAARGFVQWTGPNLSQKARRKGPLCRL